MTDKTLTAILLLFASLCATANAQDPTGTLEGRITDPSSSLVTGADVNVTNPQTGLTRSVKSSGDGAFHFSNLPVGAYTLTVNAAGFAAFSASSIRLDIGQIVTYPVTLQLSGAHAEVVVVAQTVMVDTSQTIGNVVSSAEA